jgi:predicted short-subunit dehydrogenase-like oxidoreductase (DUF2520 family)
MSTGFTVKGPSLTIYVIGAGKVGTLLTKALRARGVKVTLRADRSGLPNRPIGADLLILAVRDGRLAPLARELAGARVVGHRTAVVHCAGALGPEPLGALRGLAAGVAQMHPMISFASPDALPSLRNGQVNVAGDRAAVRRASQVARLLEMTPRTLPRLDKIAYHAAAGLVANGAAALAAAGARLLRQGGVDSSTATSMLGPLLRSVGDNVEKLGLPDALTGPVRRGDVAALGRHLEVIRSRAPELVPLYVELVRAQLPLARKIGDAAPGTFRAIESLIGPRARKRVD